MTYAEFKQNFLPQFLNIKTFSGKMEYAKQNLQRIGSGTGRIVYDIDGQKVLKLAKNTKGIAQNAEESSIGRDYYVANIVTEVFEAADDDSWLIAEKAKKVNENRIKQLTGIPSLTELYYYLSQFKEENKGRRVKCEGRFHDLRQYLYGTAIPMVMQPDATMLREADLQDLWDCLVPNSNPSNPVHPVKINVNPFSLEIHS